MWITEVICFPFKVLFLALIYFYKFCISPFTAPACKFTPTCSSYAISAIKKFGPFKGLALAFKRVLRCNPKSKGGYDPVPDDLKGDLKWLV